MQLFRVLFLILTLLLSACASYQSARQTAWNLPPENCEKALWDAWTSAGAWGAPPTQSVLNSDIAKCYKGRAEYEANYNVHMEMANKAPEQDGGDMGNWAPTVSMPTSEAGRSVDKNVSTNNVDVGVNRGLSASGNKSKDGQVDNAMGCIVQAEYGGANVVNKCSSPVLVFWCTEGGGFEACQMYKDRQIQEIGLAAMKDKQYDVGFVKSEDTTVLYPEHSMTHFSLGVCPYPGKIKVRFNEQGIDYTYECWR